MSRSLRRLTLCLLTLAILASGCALVFSPEVFQNLRLVFRLTEALDKDSKTAVQSLFFPGPVVAKGKFVRVSGQLTPAGDEALPGKILLVAETVDADTGAFKHRFKLILKIDDEGKFTATKKFKKNFPANSLMTVTAEPKGADLVVDAQVKICVDMVQQKSYLQSIGECVQDSGGGGGGGLTATLSSIQDEIFTPRCATSGCHNAFSNSGGLVLDAGQSFGNLVGVPSNQQPFTQRVDPGRPGSSYLIDKLNGSSNIVGVRMPLGGPFLSDQQMDQIVQWIDDGAEDN